MKKITISTAFLVLLLLFSCKCYEKIDYGKLSSEELIRKEQDLKLKLNYCIVNSVISDIENGKTHMPLTKIDDVITNTYLQIDPRLEKVVNEWKLHSSKIGEFEKKYKPELQELGKLLIENKISRDLYFEKNRQFRGELRNDYPKIYPELSVKHINSLRLMWRKAGRLMIEDYKEEKREFPVNWIPKEDFDKAKSSEEYKCIENTIAKINKKKT